MNDENNNNTDKPELTEKTPGALLQQARESRGFTIEHISSQLRLSRKVIKSLEDDNYDELPAPIFVRGYIRSYAALVGLEANKISESYSQLIQGAEASISLDAAHLGSLNRNSGSDKRSWLLPVVSVVLVVCLGIIIWYSQSSETDQQNIEEVASGDMMNPASPNVAIEPKPGDDASVQILAVPVEEPEVEQMASSESTSETAPAEDQVETRVDEPVEVAQQAVAKEPQELDQLTLEFNADSWVDVRDASGQRLIYRMMKSGERQAVSGKPPFILTLGNAPEIILMRNGAKVDLSPYTRGKVAKFRLGDIGE